MSDSQRDRLSSAAIGKMMEWIQACRIQHLSCRAQTKGILPTRVVDISPIDDLSHVRLVEGSACSPAEYVALSHCWGNMPPNSTDL